MPDVLHTFMQDGRTHLIVRVHELVVEVVIEPVPDEAGDTLGHRFWLRSTGALFETPEDARDAALREMQRLSRVRMIVGDASSSAAGEFPGC